MTVSFADARDQSPRLRRPIALRLSADETLLYVANRASGSLSVVDLSLHQVVAEVVVGKQLSDMVSVGDSRFLATDEAGHELILIGANGTKIEVLQRLPIAPFPVSVVVSADRRFCTVASLWSRRLTCVDLPFTNAESMCVAGVIDLPFAPRCQTFGKDDQRLIVGDAFAGRLAVVNPQSRQVLAVREFPAHNIRGLQVSPNGQMLMVAHQMLNELAHTIRNDVHWGLLMSNDLRWLKLDSVLSADGNLYADAHMHPLGQAGNASGDPSGLTVTASGTVFVSTGGINEIAMGMEDDFSLHRVPVGKRPTALIARRDGEQVYVANTFGDSVSIVNVADREAVAEVSLGTQPELTHSQKGELLFYDARISHDGWMSCHSCHTDGHTNGLINDNFSDKYFGAAKQVLSLLGRRGTEPFAWNGNAEDLPTQIRNSAVHTMQSNLPLKDHDVAALVAFIESLPPPPSIDVLRATQDLAAVNRGSTLFDHEGCANCHAPPLYTTPLTYDVGLEDKQGNREFNPPSLLGVGQRGPYFHDNRATGLEDVLRVHKHQLDRDLPNQDLSDLMAFLRSL